MFGQRRSFAPVREGDELDVKIEAVGEKGDGIAKKQGFVLFVPGTKEGDEVKVRVTRVLRNAGFAEVIKGGSPAKKPEAAKEDGSVEDEASELEDASAEMDSEDFGEESAKDEPAEKGAEEEPAEPEAEEKTAKVDDDFDDDKGDDSDFDEKN
jgi:predicted RNA-binding protein with TRAM domain